MFTIIVLTTLYLIYEKINVFIHLVWMNEYIYFLIYTMWNVIDQSQPDFWDGSITMYKYRLDVWENVTNYTTALTSILIIN